MNPIQVVTIDFWNTLYELPGTAVSRDEIRYEHILRLAQSLDIDDSEIPKILFRTIDGFIKERWKQGLHSTDEDVLCYLAGRFRCLTAAKAQTFLECIDGIHRTALKPTPLPGAPEFLHWAGARFPLYLISDTYTIRGRVIDAVLQDDGLLASFKSTFYSDVIGVEKPDTKAIGLILAVENVLPSHVLHIGDLENRDGEMSRRAGCRFALFKSFKELKRCVFS